MTTLLPLNKSEINLLFKALYRIGFTHEDNMTNFIQSMYNKYTSPYRYEHTTVIRLIYRQIIDEYNFRKIVNPEDIDFSYTHIQQFLKTKPIENHITASDIAQYAFCPVSFCIKKTFDETPNKKDLLESTQYGIEFHEQNRLLRYSNNNYSPNDIINGNSFLSNHYETQNELDFLSEIVNSTATYVGHSDNKVKYFKSSKGFFFGQPDYIFTNKSGNNFIVEEKFKKDRGANQSFSQNHKEQLLSYLHGLDSINATHGYLIYWFYDFHSSRYNGELSLDSAYITGYQVLKIKKSEDVPKSFKEIYRNIYMLLQGNIFDFFPENTNYNKCISCVVRKFCGHKTKMFTNLQVPYKTQYYELKHYSEEYSKLAQEERIFQQIFNYND